MIWTHLLRIRCEPLQQTSLFSSPKAPSDVIVEAIQAAPTAHVGRGSEWHIARPELIDDDAIGFKMGRLTEVTVPQYDSFAQDFYEAEAERAPYTFGVFDTKTQSCGVMKRQGVSQNAHEIASKLEKLLNSSAAPEKAGFRIVVDAINDPEDFIHALDSADSIIKFSFTASFPNVFDAQNQIQLPAEQFTKAVGGTQTTVEVKGENLEKDILEDLARGAAATGEQAAATIKQSGKKSKRIYLRGSPVQEPIEAEPSSSIYTALKSATIKAYHRVRTALP